MGSRLENKIGKCLETGEFYEAHQIYRTLYFRLTAAKKFEELHVLLAQGVENMIKAAQPISAIDLAELYADSLLTSKAEATEKNLATITRLFSILPSSVPTANETGIEDRRTKFISKLIIWSQSIAKTVWERKRGLASLHAQLGAVFHREGTLESARKHYLFADEPENLAKLVVEMQEKEGSASEIDLFAVLVVFQLICVRRVRVADIFLSTYCRIHPKLAKDSQPYPLPLLNFAALLIQAIPKHKASYFAVLFDKYQSEIMREPAFRSYLDKIGQLYFGLPPPRGAGPGGLLGNLFKGLLGDSVEKKEDSAEEDEYGGEPMEEDGYDTAPEEDDEQTKKNIARPKARDGASVIQDTDDLD